MSEWNKSAKTLPEPPSHSLGFLLKRMQAEGLTGVQASEFARLRNAQLARFTVERLRTLLNRLKCRVAV